MEKADRKVGVIKEEFQTAGLPFFYFKWQVQKEGWVAVPKFQVRGWTKVAKQNLWRGIK